MDKVSSRHLWGTMAVLDGNEEYDIVRPLCREVAQEAGATRDRRQRIMEAGEAATPGGVSPKADDFRQNVAGGLTRMRDLLLLMYKQNEQYHTAKETMFWLSTTLYLGFSAYATNWILTVHLRSNDFLYFIAIALVAVIFAVKFATRQNWLKCLSVIWSEGYMDLLLETLDDDSIRRGLRELAAEVEKIEKRPSENRKIWRKKNRQIWREKGKPGTWIVPLLWVFFAGQQVVIAYRLGIILS